MRKLVVSGMLQRWSNIDGNFIFKKIPLYRRYDTADLTNLLFNLKQGQVLMISYRDMRVCNRYTRIAYFSEQLEKEYCVSNYKVRNTMIISLKGDRLALPVIRYIRDNVLFKPYVIPKVVDTLF